MEIYRITQASTFPVLQGCSILGVKNTALGCLDMVQGIFFSDIKQKHVWWVFGCVAGVCLMFNELRFIKYAGFF